MDTQRKKDLVLESYRGLTTVAELCLREGIETGEKNHCTALPMTIRLSNMLGPRYKKAFVGSVIEVLKSMRFCSGAQLWRRREMEAAP